jgi:predicted phosphodiesterase
VRIASLADIHGNLPALRAVIDDLKHRTVDMIVNLGETGFISRATTTASSFATRPSATDHQIAMRSSD